VRGRKSKPYTAATAEHRGKTGLHARAGGHDRGLMEWSSFFSALLGGALALAGQGVQASFSRSSELRQRGEAAAAAILDLLQQVEALYPKGTDKYGRLESHLEPTRDLEIAKLRGEAHLIPQAPVRERVSEVGSMLGDLFAIEQFGGVTERKAVWELSRWLEAVVGSYLRRERQANEPDFLSEYRAAISDAYAAWDEQYETQREYERTQREAGSDSQGERGTDA